MILRTVGPMNSRLLPSLCKVAPPLAFAIHGPIAPSDLPGLCNRVCALLAQADGCDVECDVRGVEPDAVTVDALARLQLAAARRGCRVLLRGSSPELRELVAFMGLDGVLVS
jgi:ABC-type transporter Mla MlaB component